MLFKEYLLNVNGNKACIDARRWNGDRTLSECWRDCERGDWMMWLLFNANLCDLRTLTKIKAMQADLVKHLMKDERSLAALQAAHDFGNGMISQDELTRFADADNAANAANANAAAYAVARAAAYAANAANANANAAAYAAAAVAAADARAAAARAAAARAAAYAVAANAVAADAVADAVGYAVAYAGVGGDGGDAVGARAETLKKCADIVRSVIPSVTIEGVE